MSLSSPILSSQTAAWIQTFARITMGACFVVYGLSKLKFIDGTTAFVGTKLPFPSLVFWLAVVLETGLGFLMVIGYATRWAACYFAFHCVFTAFVFHTNFASRPQFDHFFANVALAAGLLYIVATGPGAAALDNARAR
jgi:putative oxidoreductase